MQRQVRFSDPVYMNSVLEEMNFYNLIHYLKPELLRIREGGKATQVIPGSRFRRNLEDQGILVCYHGGGGKKIKISDRVLRIMEENGWET